MLRTVAKQIKSCVADQMRYDNFLKNFTASVVKNFKNKPGKYHIDTSRKHIGVTLATALH